MSELFMDLQRKKFFKSKDSYLNQLNLTEAKTKPHNDVNNNDVNSPNVENGDEPFGNILSLKLKKPKHWKWELSTSKSSSNISLPRILLYDHKGQLLVDANSQQEQVFNERNSSQQRKQRKYSFPSRAVTSNLEQSIKEVLDYEFHNFHINEVTPSVSPEPLRLSKETKSSSCRSINFNTFDLPDYEFRRPYSRNISSNDSFNLANIPTPPSTSTPTGTTPSSSSTGPREKKRYRKSFSSTRSPIDSPSILERFSFRKGRSSSPESVKEQLMRHEPKYFLSSNKLGTLIVKEDSFNLHPNRRRRRVRHSSAETLNSSSKPPSIVPNNHYNDLSHCHAEKSSSSSLRSRSRTRRKHKTHHLESLSAGRNIKDSSPLSTSEEEFQSQPETRRDKKSLNAHRFAKKDLARLDSGVSSSFTGL